MAPSRLSVLAGLMLLVGVLSWILVATEYDSLPALAVVGPLTLVILAIIEFGFAFSVRKRLRDPKTPVRRRLEPLFVARLAVLAKASSHAAAAVAGLYGGFFVYTLAHLGKAAINSDARTSGISLAASVALVGAALFLEYGCRVPRGPGDDRRRP